MIKIGDDQYFQLNFISKNGVDSFLRLSPKNRHRILAAISGDIESKRSALLKHKRLRNLGVSHLRFGRSLRVCFMPVEHGLAVVFAGTHDDFNKFCGAFRGDSSELLQFDEAVTKLVAPASNPTINDHDVSNKFDSTSNGELSSNKENWVYWSWIREEVMAHADAQLDLMAELFDHRLEEVELSAAEMKRAQKEEGCVLSDQNKRLIETNEQVATEFSLELQGQAKKLQSLAFQSLATNREIKNFARTMDVVQNQATELIETCGQIVQHEKSCRGGLKQVTKDTKNWRRESHKQVMCLNKKIEKMQSVLSLMQSRSARAELETQAIEAASLNLSRHFDRLSKALNRQDEMQKFQMLKIDEISQRLDVLDQKTKPNRGIIDKIQGIIRAWAS